MANRHGRAVHDRDKTERARRLAQYPAVDDLEGLAEALVLGYAQVELRLRDTQCQQREPGELRDSQRQTRSKCRCHEHRSRER